MNLLTVFLVIGVITSSGLALRCEDIGAVCKNATGCSQYYNIPNICPAGQRCCPGVPTTTTMHPDDCRTVKNGWCTALMGGYCPSGYQSSLGKGCSINEYCCYPGVNTTTPAPGAHCGTKSNSKIVGGEDAKRGGWPWQAGIRRYGRHFCGGTVLNDQWVISAAHCFYGMVNGLDDWAIVLGAHVKEADEGHETVMNISKILLHANYDPDTNEDDIALIKLTSPVSYSKMISQVCLPKEKEDFTGLTCTVTGWGRTQEGGDDAEVLQQVQVPIITNDACQYKLRHFYVDIYSTSICAGHAEGGKDACQNDSGGPLMCKKANEGWKIAGIVSWGIGCAQRDRPGVYTRVSAYLDWINNQIKNP